MSARCGGQAPATSLTQLHPFGTLSQPRVQQDNFLKQGYGPVTQFPEGLISFPDADRLRAKHLLMSTSFCKSLFPGRTLFHKPQSHTELPAASRTAGAHPGMQACTQALTQRQNAHPSSLSLFLPHCLRYSYLVPSFLLQTIRQAVLALGSRSSLVYLHKSYDDYLFVNLFFPL